MLENIIGVDEAATILELSPGTVKNMCAAGKLKCKKIGKTWILNKEDLQVKKFNILNELTSTILEWEGITLKTTQDPYLDDDIYRAIAVDKNDDKYEIKWKITNYETTDESESCDWDNPIKVIKL